MKILIVGLPLFAERLKKNLSEFDQENKYYFLDTYYNKWDRLKAIFLIPYVDAIYSINGTLETSKVIDLAFKLNKKVIMNWVGTDVLKAKEAFKSGRHKEEYISKATHFCEVNWIKEELKEINIDAKVVSFVAFDNKFNRNELTSESLNVLSYIPSNRAKFYGMDQFLQLAKTFPSVNFTIVGSEGEDYLPLPGNVTALGWVDNMGELFEKNHICLRFPEHDGLSIFILESLARAKQVLYKYPFDHCLHCPDENGLENQLRKLENDFIEGKSMINNEGANFIASNYSEKKVFGDLIQQIKKVNDEK